MMTVGFTFHQDDCRSHLPQLWLQDVTPFERVASTVLFSCSLALEFC